VSPGGQFFVSPDKWWTVFGALNASFRSERNGNPTLTPLGAGPSHWHVNLQGGVRSPDARWELALWVTNLNDELDRSLASFSPLQGRAQRRTRSTSR
jgi:outer membrane receptor protein involved in Fe transport